MSPPTVKIVVHEFFVDDVEDSIIYAALPISEWENSEAGQWVTEHSITPPVWSRIASPDYHRHQFVITARLTETDATYYALRWK